MLIFPAYEHVKRLHEERVERSLARFRALQATRRHRESEPAPDAEVIDLPRREEETARRIGA